MTRTVTRGLAALALSVAALGPHGAAAAAPGNPSDPQQLLRLSTSPSGPWADNLPSPLYGTDDGPLVPGDTIPKSFFVFGNPGTKAQLRLDCTIGGQQPFAERLDLEYRVNGGGYESCEDEHESFTVTGRSSHKVDVSLGFADTGEGQTGDMDREATYSITVTLSQLPPKGGGKPQVLGAQTLVAAPPATETSGGTSTGDSSTASNRGADDPTSDVTNGKGKTKTTPVRTTNASAVLPEPNVGLAESLPLIGGLLVAGALLAGWRRRREDAP